MKTSHWEPPEVILYWEKKTSGQIFFLEIPDIKFEDLSLWRRPVCQTLSEAWVISRPTAKIVTDLLNALAVLSDITVRRSAIAWKDLNHIGHQKKGHICLGDQQSFYVQVFPRLH